jgi:hypothetical protein
MPYVERDANGTVKGKYENCQPGYAEEWLDVGDEALVPTMASLQAAKLAEVNELFQVATAALTAGYPPDEKDSWPNQTLEATSWNQDNNAPTPYLDSLASYRGITPLEYRQKTVAKVLAYKEASAFLIGTRQKYADQIASATSQANLDAIVPNFTLPGA